MKLGKAAGGYVADGLENVLTGMGLGNYDPRLGGRYRWRPANYVELEQFHDSSDIAQVVCDRIPAYATKKWLTHIVSEDSGGADMVAALMGEDDRLCAKEKFRKAMSWARIYGGAMMLLVVDDGLELADPLDVKKINKIENLVILHRWEVYRQIINQRLGDPNFGLPEFFAVTGRTVTSVPQIHHTRFIRFDGSPLSEEGFRKNDYWDDSHLTKLFEIARDYDDAYNGVALALKDFGINILKIKDLAGLVAGDNEGMLQKRIRLMQMSKSILTTAVIDSQEEDYDLLERTFTNVAQTLDKLDKRLQMVTGLPHTILFGEGSTGTLGAGGESERSTLADLVATEQDMNLRRQFKRYSEIVQAQKLGPTKGSLIKDYTFKFNPLNEPTEQQQSEHRLRVAEADMKYIEMGVLTADEVANSRFGGDGYSTETQIDQEARELQKETAKDVPAPEPGKGVPGETPKNSKPNEKDA